MRFSTLIPAVLVLALLAGSGPVLAAGPDGFWSCRTSTGAPGGTVWLGETSYSYSSAPGAAATFGRSRIDGDSVAIVDGPLTGLGVRSGAYAVGPFLPAYFDAGSPDSRSQLNFGMGPGQGLLCSPDRADPQP